MALIQGLLIVTLVTLCRSHGHFGLLPPQYTVQQVPLVWESHGQYKLPWNHEGSSNNWNVHHSSDYWNQHVPHPSGSWNQHVPHPSGGWNQHVPHPSGSWNQHVPNPSHGWNQHVPNPPNSWNQHVPNPSDGLNQHNPHPSNSWNQHNPHPSNSGKQPNPHPSNSGKQPNPHPSNSGKQPNLHLPTPHPPHSAKLIKPTSKPKVKPVDIVLEVFGEDRGASANQPELPGAPMFNDTNNPCDKIIVKKKYTRPGRRLSEEKCLQFVGNMKAREEELNKTSDCTLYLNQLLGTLGVNKVQVVGGRIAEPGEFLHMGAMGFKGVDGGWVFKCGASIVSEKFLVTAGHCTRSARDPKISNQDPEIVRIGAHDLKENKPFYPKDHKISRIIKHPNYKPPKQYFDIALLEVEQPIRFDFNVQPACLWHLPTDNLRNKVSASGWGATDVDGKTTTTQLQVGDLDLIADNTCDELLRPLCNKNRWCGLQDHQVCAAKLDGGVDACKGDSGGPLQFKIDLPASVKGRIYYLVGVTSFGFGCARPNSPGVYTRVSSFVDWIEQNVWANETRRA